MTERLDCEPRKFGNESITKQARGCTQVWVRTMGWEPNAPSAGFDDFGGCDLAASSISWNLGESLVRQLTVLSQTVLPSLLALALLVQFGRLALPLDRTETR